MFFSLDTVLNWLFVYKYVVLFPFIILEGPFVSMTAGFLSSINVLNIFIVYPLVVTADLAGDLIYYSIGRWGGKRLIQKYEGLFRLKQGNIERIEAHFEKHTKKTIIIGKISHAFGAPILLAAGMAKVKIYEIFWSNFVVTIPKYIILLFIGYYFGQGYVFLTKYSEYISLALVSVGILLIFIFFGYNRFRAKLDMIIKKYTQ
jgi:membrane protein DedA with SNARE-associated domain